jgi:hypothetical protein
MARKTYKTKYINPPPNFSELVAGCRWYAEVRRALEEADTETEGDIEFLLSTMNDTDDNERESVFATMAMSLFPEETT